MKPSISFVPETEGLTDVMIDDTYHGTIYQNLTSEDDFWFSVTLDNMQYRACGLSTYNQATDLINKFFDVFMQE